MGWLAVIGGAIQLVFLILSNQFNHNEEEKKRKEKLHEDWAEAIKSGDVDRINKLLLLMRS